MAGFDVGVEIERKYIIAMPRIEDMAAMDGYSASSIVQTYLTAPAGQTRRVRRRESKSGVKYYETVKRRIDKISSEERERELTEAEYEAMLPEIAEGSRPIIKTRHIFSYRNQLIEIDVYPEWKSTAILETELPSRECVAELPEFIRVIREVTGIKGYSNAAMSRSFPKEDI